MARPATVDARPRGRLPGQHDRRHPRRCPAAPTARRGCTPSCGSGWASGSAASGSPGCCGSSAGAGSATAASAGTGRLPAVHEDLVQRRFVADWPGPAVVHRHHRAPHRGPGRSTAPRCSTCSPAQIVGWSIADHMRSELVVDALQMATWRRRPEPGTDRALRPRQPVHVLGLRAPAPRRRPARIDGPRRILRRQLDDRVVLVDHAARAARHPALGHPGAARPRRSSSGSRPGTTPAAGTPPRHAQPVDYEHYWQHNAFTPPPTARHDHHTTRVRRTGSGSGRTRRSQPCRRATTDEPAGC